MYTNLYSALLPVHVLHDMHKKDILFLEKNVWHNTPQYLAVSV